MKRGIRIASSAKALQAAAHMLKSYMIPCLLLVAVTVETKKTNVDPIRYL
jgi:hypothetical protein